MVKYSFSYALTLVDDFHDALHLLQDDPTGAQIVVETDIKDCEPGSAFSELNIYFLIQKSEWKKDTEEYKETPYYTLSICYVDADESVIKPLLQYEGNYSLEDLKNIVCEIADNHYITCIYPDSRFALRTSRALYRASK